MIQTTPSVEERLILFRNSLEEEFLKHFDLPKRGYTTDLSDAERSGFITLYQYTVNSNIPTPNDEFWVAEALCLINLVNKNKIDCDNNSLTESLFVSDRVAKIRNSILNGDIVYDLKMGGNGVNVGISQLLPNQFWKSSITFSVDTYFYIPKTIKGEIIQ